jgi:hypothetical protein
MLPQSLEEFRIFHGHQITRLPHPLRSPSAFNPAHRGPVAPPHRPPRGSALACSGGRSPVRSKYNCGSFCRIPCLRGDLRGGMHIVVIRLRIFAFSRHIERVILDQDLDAQRASALNDFAGNRRRLDACPRENCNPKNGFNNSIPDRRQPCHLRTTSRGIVRPASVTSSQEGNPRSFAVRNRRGILYKTYIIIEM